MSIPKLLKEDPNAVQKRKEKKLERRRKNTTKVSLYELREVLSEVAADSWYLLEKFSQVSECKQGALLECTPSHDY